MYKPPINITPDILSICSKIEKLLGKYEGLGCPQPKPQLRRSHKIKTIWSTVSIEGNNLYEHQVETVLDGKKVVGPDKDILEVKNAFACYEESKSMSPTLEKDFLKAHRIMMKNLINDAGKYRNKNVGILGKGGVRHIAPKPTLVPKLMSDLFNFTQENKNLSPLVLSSVMHYEIEFIHPFQDGNGRMGRFWQHLHLIKYHAAFDFVPVESLIYESQKQYYEALAKSDKAGEATVFVLYILEKIHHGLDLFIANANRIKHTTESRLEEASQKLGTEWFSRGAYNKLHSQVSSATATRDLKVGVESELLESKGSLRLAKYRFK